MFYVLHGDEEFLRAEAVASLKAQVMEDGMGDLNITELDGTKVALRDLIDACSTLPFLTSRRLVIITDFLQQIKAPGRRSSGKQPKQGQDQILLDDLLAYLPKMPESTRLVFVESHALGSTHPLVKVAGKSNNFVREFSRPEGRALQHWIAGRCKQKDVEIEPEALNMLASLSAHSCRLIDQELEKLAGYVGYGQSISADAVRNLVSASQEADIFGLVDSLGLRQRDRAIQLLHNLIADGANELYLLTMFARQFRLIVSVKDLAENENKSPADIQRELHISHSFIVEKLLRQAKQFGFSELLAIQKHLLDADQSIKTGTMEGKLALQLLIIGICRQPRKRRPQASSALAHRHSKNH